MLNPFPELLVYGFFAPTILRIAAAFIFLYVAYMQAQHREIMAKIPFPVVGNSLGMGVVWFAVAVELALSAALVIGYSTQAAAIIGMIAAAKYFFFGRRWPTFAPISRGTAILLFVILASLLLSGAGGLAYDLPL